MAQQLRAHTALVENPGYVVTLYKDSPGLSELKKAIAVHPTFPVLSV